MNTARVITIIQKRIRPGLENLIKTEKNKEVDGLMANYCEFNVLCII
jgi:hypothetical protein